METFIHKNILITKKDNKYFLTGGIIPSNYNDEESDVIFSITPYGIKIEDFHDLFQFNCSSSNYDLIEAILYIYALETNTEMINLNTLTSKSWEYFSLNFSDIEIKHKVPNGEHFYDQTFSFKFKGHQINGTNQMMKYSFFDPEDTNISVYNLISSVEELIDYYITVNKILAIACFIDHDDLFLSCDDWAKEQVEKYIRSYISIT